MPPLECNLQTGKPKRICKNNHIFSTRQPRKDQVYGLIRDEKSRFTDGSLKVIFRTDIEHLKRWISIMSDFLNLVANHGTTTSIQMCFFPWSSSQMRDKKIEKMTQTMDLFKKCVLLFLNIWSTSLARQEFSLTNYRESLVEKNKQFIRWISSAHVFAMSSHYWNHHDHHWKWLMYTIELIKSILTVLI